MGLEFSLAVSLVTKEIPAKNYDLRQRSGLCFVGLGSVARDDRVQGLTPTPLIGREEQLGKVSSIYLPSDDSRSYRSALS